MENADDFFQRYKLIIKDLLNIVDKPKSALIMSQQKVVNLQEELLEKQKEELRILGEGTARAEAKADEADKQAKQKMKNYADRQRHKTLFLSNKQNLTSSLLHFTKIHMLSLRLKDP